MAVSNYQDLIVWQKSMILAKMVYAVVKKLPKEELYALSDQIRRAVVSIPSNIAEGCARESKTELAYFLRIAKGSSAELETQLLLCSNIGYLQKQELSDIFSLLDEISRMLRALLNPMSDISGRLKRKTVSTNSELVTSN
ncbi:MAG: four helix bundle protein [Fibrobacter sp.]|nr:four helix bundle protein [Fibrobacter sp.]